MKMVLSLPRPSWGVWSVLVPGLALLLCLALALMGCVFRKKRRMEGMYRPSAEESKQTGPRGAERPGLPRPKKERLI